MRFKDFIRAYTPAYTVSVSLAVLGVGCGMVPYITVHRLLMRLAKGGTSVAEVSAYVGVIIAAFAFQLVLHSISTAISHKTAFSVLEKIRLALTEKMIKMPLGFTRNKGAGYFHGMLIDSIERLEFPLAHPHSLEHYRDAFCNRLAACSCRFGTCCSNLGFLSSDVYRHYERFCKHLLCRPRKYER